MCCLYWWGLTQMMCVTVMYSLSLVFGFLFIPFAYFYYEEDDEDVTVRQKMIGAAKYTFFLVLVVSILLIIGLLIKPGKRPDVKDGEWMGKVVDSGSQGQGSIDFTIAVLFALGFTAWITYTAYGFASMPIRLIKGKLSASSEQKNIDSDLNNQREKIRKLESKYAITGKKMSRREQKELESMKRQERLLSHRTQALESRTTGWHRVLEVLQPFYYLFGILFMLFTILIMVSFLLGLIDKAALSCGSACGFITVHPTFNPFDKMLVALSHAFPMDYICLMLTISYVFFATLHGIKRVGIRFLWLKLFKLRPGQSVPQALMFTAEILMFVVLTLGVILLTLAPQYATFGTQTYVLDGKVVECTLSAPSSECHITQLALFVNRISLRMSTFPFLYFILSWLIIAVFLIGCAVATFKGKVSNLEDEGNSSDSSDDDY
eukprot:TRINITY_DN497_c1_g2_i1.p1 TRINITY_DN497_c1_g2~~TRINITY_DN497_c1_g2_i1.p1  ORF type:complete len:434 (+),score=132.02 TRINITY_DN497_c1_g2_i1:518-1819(+)